MNRIGLSQCTPPLSPSVGPISRRAAAQALGAVGLSVLVDSCGGWPARAPAKQNPQPVPNAASTPVSVWVSRAQIGVIGERFAGLSYEKASMALPRFSQDNADLIGLFTGLGHGLLRLGGNSVDQTQWTPDGAGRTRGQVAPADIDALASFLQLSGWTVLYGVNLATSTPQAAAAEVRYVAQTLGSSLYGIEIGNECDLYRGHYFQNWTLQDFERRWTQFRNAIYEIEPNLAITGPASADNVESWTLPFGQDVSATQIALLTQHYYRGDGQSSSATQATLISPDVRLVQELGWLKAGAASNGVPFRITETNSFYNGGAVGVSNSYASALWVIDHLFSIALGGATGANLHGGGHSAGYTPIADLEGTVLEARPEYYGVLLFTLAGRGRLLETTVMASGCNLTAYALRPAAGGLRVIVVNKENDRHLTLQLHCGDTVSSATALLLTGPSLEATSGVSIQGATIPKDGSFSPNWPYTLEPSGSVVNCFLPPASAMLITMS